ncbi:hypothetical protein QQS21_012293 [Conoideocrella luteorostrata]|uniref:Uncharacterized protein n=1 Tax=Conoideocrella luteorostrata TaxID=1105319 RepID=A0AAJ0CCJ5_9HYPO|nr:hypothetical protein QQS21_012293 [Conoideocrella luteorostrata]
MLVNNYKDLRKLRRLCKEIGQKSAEDQRQREIEIRQCEAAQKLAREDQSPHAIKQRRRQAARALASWERARGGIYHRAAAEEWASEERSRRKELEGLDEQQQLVRLQELEAAKALPGEEQRRIKRIEARIRARMRGKAPEEQANKVQLQRELAGLNITDSQT